VGHWLAVVIVGAGAVTVMVVVDVAVVVGVFHGVATARRASDEKTMSARENILCILFGLRDGMLQLLSRNAVLTFHDEDALSFIPLPCEYSAGENKQLQISDRTFRL